ncbi:MAG: hypothetical protein F6K23_03735 [Okeania sp. SIO2C9]|uniref:hypothetical protein n=1 Tax=Okeania sp. SIO2C9 TaxID=2607791 RepID=UPI0013C158B6|nr:hypothetical protein [Okeania sp. SIO2C9]NEQ72264.1 hypothetical protein [Okeania sp. SIO2C9]
MEPITWAVVIGGTFLLGAAVGHFWDDIKAWLTRVTKNLLDSIDKTIDVLSEAMVYLVKENKRFYKRVEIYVRNKINKNRGILYEQKEIAEIDIPEDMKEPLYEQEKLQILRGSTS